MSEKPAPASSSTVLVVDDDPGIRESVTEVLTSEGYRVFEAADGELALARLQDMKERCVVLLDLAMPKMNGLEVLTALSRQGDTERFPVVVMSANAHPREL
jgi:CheY-like chemotaxis protein